MTVERFRRAPGKLLLAGALVATLAACSGGGINSLPTPAGNAGPNAVTPYMAMTRGVARSQVRAGAQSGAIASSSNQPGATPGAVRIGSSGSGIGRPKNMIVAGPPPPPTCNTEGTCVTCPNGKQGDGCGDGNGGGGGGYNPGPPPTGGGGSNGGSCGFNQVNCNPCYTGQGGAGCPGTPAQVATTNPYRGAPCDGAEAHGIPIVLGTSNIPGNTSGVATSVVNIYSIQNASGYVAGWVYTTENNDIYFEGNPNQIPVLSAIMSFLLDTVDSPTLQTPDSLKRIKSADEQGGYKEHHCFSKNLPSSDLG